jgi:transcription termination factor Rho
VARERSQPAAQAEPAAEAPRPRRRRRRRFGRRKQGVTLQTLLLPPEAGRQALVFAESREGCTALLRGVAADLAADAKGPDPVALLIDPSPEELADWKRDAPQAEIVSAGQPRHASDALAQAATRAGKGEDVILLVDSLTRLGEAYDDAEAAKEFFDAGRAQGSAGGGSLTVVAALERSAD